MFDTIPYIDSKESMIETIHRFGIIPFFRCKVPGWSIEDLTVRECWFFENGADGVLGPWDWKVDCVQQGDIAYGKFLGGKAAFATVEWYQRLMCWRRSQQRYNDLPEMAATAREVIRELETVNMSTLRAESARRMGCPTIRKAEMEKHMQLLQMGTWTVVGDIERVFNGPQLTYKGWQKAVNVTPDDLFIDFPAPHRSPEQAHAELVEHVQEFFPDAGEKLLEKII